MHILEHIVYTNSYMDVKTIKRVHEFERDQENYTTEDLEVNKWCNFITISKKKYLYNKQWNKQATTNKTITK